jgi:hypothetical protein
MPPASYPTGFEEFSMARRSLPFLMALGVLVPSLSTAAGFDFIYTDRVTMRAPLASWSITLAGTDFGLIVNKGATGLSADDLNAADFSVDGVPEWPDSTSPTIDPRLRPGINPGYLYHPSFQPILANEAVGSVSSPNDVLLPLVGAGETFRNSSPAQFIYFELGGMGNSPGVVRFDVHLRIGDDAVSFSMFVTLIDSPSYSIEFTHASRVSSSALPVTAAKATTWGRVKSLYR